MIQRTGVDRCNRYIFAFLLQRKDTKRIRQEKNKDMRTDIKAYTKWKDMCKWIENKLKNTTKQLKRQAKRMKQSFCCLFIVSEFRRFLKHIARK